MENFGLGWVMTLNPSQPKLLNCRRLSGGLHICVAAGVLTVFATFYLFIIMLNELVNGIECLHLHFCFSFNIIFVTMIKNNYSAFFELPDLSNGVSFLQSVIFANVNKHSSMPMYGNYWVLLGWVGLRLEKYFGFGFGLEQHAFGLGLGWVTTEKNWVGLGQ
jgi:hypothetical protein